MGLFILIKYNKKHFSISNSPIFMLFLHRIDITGQFDVCVFTLWQLAVKKDDSWHIQPFWVYLFFFIIIA